MAESRTGGARRADRRPTSGAFGTGVRLLGRVARMMPGRSVVLMLLTILNSFLQGLSLVLLLPVLGSIGIGTSSGAAGGRFILLLRDAYATVGIPYTLATILLLVFAVGILGALVQLSLSWLGHAMFRKFVVALQVETYEAIVRSRLSHLASRSRGDATIVLTKMCEQAGQGFFLTVRLLTNVVMALGLIVIAALQAWVLVASILGLFALLAVPMKLNSRVMQRLVRRAHDTHREVGAHLAEHLRLLTTIKAMGIEADSVKSIAGYVRSSNASAVRFKRRIEAVKSIWGIVVVGLVCAVTYVGAAVLALPPARLILLIGVSMRMVPALQGIITGSEQLPFMLMAYDDVMDFTREARAAAEPDGGAQLDVPALRSGVMLKDVVVEEGGGRILDGVSLEIPPGSLVALVGQSGSGKTTTIGAILGLVDVSSGSVRIEGAELSSLRRRSWRQRVGYVAQDLPILSGTIRENLALSVPDAGDAAMTSALEAAGAGAFLHSLPDGLDTFVGEQGSKISGGERQRLVIARALLRNPALLILDEATNALDAETATRTLATVRLLRARCAVLMVAHDLNMVRDADAIYVLDRGRIVEHGKWDDLVAKQGRFATLSGNAGKQHPQPVGEEVDVVGAARALDALDAPDATYAGDSDDE